MTTATTGAGIFDNYNSLVQSIQDDSRSEGEKVCGVAVDAASAITDTVSFAMDPLAGIVSAGVGWLLEHVQFLREPLDALMGNPDEIQQNVDQLKTQAANVAQLADQHKQDQQAVKDSWSGQAGDAFHSSMDRLGGELASLGKLVEGSASVVGMSGALVTTLRGMVRDLIADLVSELVEGALVAAASAVFTFGASIAGFIGFAVGRAAALAAKIASQVAKLVAGLVRQGGRLGQLGNSMSDLTKGLDRFSQAADAGQAIAGAAAPGQPDNTASGSGSSSDFAPGAIDGSGPDGSPEGDDISGVSGVSGESADDVGGTQAVGAPAESTFVAHGPVETGFAPDTGQVQGDTMPGSNAPADPDMTANRKFVVNRVPTESEAEA